MPKNGDVIFKNENFGKCFLESEKIWPPWFKAVRVPNSFPKGSQEQVGNGQKRLNPCHPDGKTIFFLFFKTNFHVYFSMFKT